MNSLQRLMASLLTLAALIMECSGAERLRLQDPEEKIVAILRKAFPVGTPENKVKERLEKEFKVANINVGRNAASTNPKTGQAVDFYHLRFFVDLGSYPEPGQPKNIPAETEVGATFDFDRDGRLRSVIVKKQSTGT